MAETQAKDNTVRVAFRIGYLGGDFFGSQFQPDQRTVEGEIRSACLRAGLFPDPESGRLAISGRTDRGVHARCQIIAFSTPVPDRARRALGGQFPPDIWVTAFCEVPDSYAPRRDVISRTYRYIFTDPVGDITSMREAAALFIGISDYSCMARIEQGKTPIRTVTALTVHEDHDCCWLEIIAPSYLWHMVRCIATVLIRASNKEITPDEVRALLTGRCHNKVRPACPDGLILWDIADTLDWIPVPAMNRTLRLHSSAAALHRTMERVHSLLHPEWE